MEKLAAWRPAVTTRACRLDGSAEAGAIRLAQDTDEALGAAMLEFARSADEGESLVRRVDGSSGV